MARSIRRPGAGFTAEMLPNLSVGVGVELPLPERVCHAFDRRGELVAVRVEREPQPLGGQLLRRCRLEVRASKRAVQLLRLRTSTQLGRGLADERLETCRVR